MMAAATHQAHVTLTDGTIQRVEVDASDRAAAARAAAALFPGRAVRVCCQPIDQAARVLDALALRMSAYPLVRGAR